MPAGSQNKQHTALMLAMRSGLIVQHLSPAKPLWILCKTHSSQALRQHILHGRRDTAQTCSRTLPAWSRKSLLEPGYLRLRWQR